MSAEQNVKQESVVRRTLFDYVGSDYLDLNLKIGSPSESQLKKSSEALKKATIHRLVKRDFCPCMPAMHFSPCFFCLFTE